MFSRDFYKCREGVYLHIFSFYNPPFSPPWWPSSNTCRSRRYPEAPVRFRSRKGHDFHSLLGLASEVLKEPNLPSKGNSEVS